MTEPFDCSPGRSNVVCCAPTARFEMADLISDRELLGDIGNMQLQGPEVLARDPLPRSATNELLHRRTKVGRVDRRDEPFGLHALWVRPDDADVDGCHGRLADTREDAGAAERLRHPCHKYVAWL
ncbi:Uncharacterised protein [Mycobacteroides abscessus subsp. abscessus]|nr:Uncharacterised protein [Mycobacteroides abscessus subsp. abscessus]